MIRALLFDLDNTLIDRDLAYRDYVEDLLLRIPDDGGDRHRAGAEIVEHDDGGRCNRRQHCQWLAARHSLAGWSASDFWQDQLAHLPRFVRLDPALKHLLAVLQRRFTLAIVTNGSSRNQRDKIRHAGLAHLIENVFVSEEVGCEKPAARIFHHALAELQCRPDEGVMIGDDLRNDILGARGVGLDTIWVSAKASAEEHDGTGLRISSLLQLEDALALLPVGRP